MAPDSCCGFGKICPAWGCRRYPGFELEGTYLGRAIAHAAFLLNPRKVVLGGGLSLLFDTYKSSLMDTLRCEMKRLPDGMPEVKATARVSWRAAGSGRAGIKGSADGEGRLKWVPIGSC